MRAATEYQRWAREKLSGISYSTEDMVECLICGDFYILLGSHVFQRHNLLMRKYNEQFSLDVKKGRIKEKFRKVKRDTNKTDLNKLKSASRKYWFEKGSKKAGRYVRSQETMERLHKIDREMFVKFYNLALNAKLSWGYVAKEFGLKDFRAVCQRASYLRKAGLDLPTIRKKYNLRGGKNG